MNIKTNTSTMQNLLVKLLGDKYHDYIVSVLNWRKMVGEYLGKYSSVAKVDNDILFVEVNNSSVMQEFILLRDDIRKKINRKLSLNIQKIVFYIAKSVR